MSDSIMISVRPSCLFFRNEFFPFPRNEFSRLFSKLEISNFSLLWASMKNRVFQYTIVRLLSTQPHADSHTHSHTVWGEFAWLIGPTSDGFVLFGFRSSLSCPRLHYICSRLYPFYNNISQQKCPKIRTL